MALYNLSHPKKDIRDKCTLIGYIANNSHEMDWA